MELATFLPQHIGWLEALARVGIAILLAFAIGADRYFHRKPVDFRPFVIIALASCGLGLMAVELPYLTSDPNLSVDPAKVISGVMTGIGFLGAGALFREGDVVKGTGSAASIWSAGAIGLMCGMGFIWLAGLIAVGVILVFLISRHLFAVDSYTKHREESKGGDHDESD